MGHSILRKFPFLNCQPETSSSWVMYSLERRKDCVATSIQEQKAMYMVCKVHSLSFIASSPLNHIWYQLRTMQRGKNVNPLFNANVMLPQSNSAFQISLKFHKNDNPFGRLYLLYTSSTQPRKHGEMKTDIRSKTARMRSKPFWDIELPRRSTVKKKPTLQLQSRSVKLPCLPPSLLQTY